MSFDKGRRAREAVEAREREQVMAAEQAEAPNAMDRMLSILEQQALNHAVQNERTAPKENPNYKARSIFLKPNGEPLAADLKCEVFFGNILMNRTPLTREEVDALNGLQPLDKGQITKNDGSPLPVSVKAKMTATGKIERLTVTPESQEKNLNLTMPAITAWATELSKQAAA